MDLSDGHTSFDTLDLDVKGVVIGGQSVEVSEFATVKGITFDIRNSTRLERNMRLWDLL